MRDPHADNEVRQILAGLAPQHPARLAFSARKSTIEIAHLLRDEDFRMRALLEVHRHHCERIASPDPEENLLTN
jgi:hypothetical protein